MKKNKLLFFICLFVGIILNFILIMSLFFVISSIIRSSSPSKPKEGYNFFAVDSYNLEVNQKVSLEYSVENLRFVSEDDSIASLTDSLEVIGKAPGSTRIIATDTSGNTDDVIINVSSSKKEKSSFKVSDKDIKICLNDELKINYTIVPQSDVVTWSSSDNSVVSVDKDASIKGKKIGIAIITGISKSGLKETIVVEVIDEKKAEEIKKEEEEKKEQEKKEYAIVLDRASLAISKGESYKFKATTSDTKSITWKSSDKSVATISKDGKLTTLSPGKTVVTVSNGISSASCTVTVVETKVTNKDSISLDRSTLSISKGETYTFKVSISSSNKNLTWSSTNPKVATVSKDGKLTTLSAGSTIISVTNGSITASSSVMVIERVNNVKSVSLSKSSLSLNIGETQSVTATISPSNASNKNVIWTSSNNNIAIVDSNGKITGVSTGKAVITVTSVDGNKKDDLSVEVKPILPKSITLSKTTEEINIGSSKQLTYTISPSNATDKRVTYKSSDSSVVSVSSSGKVTALKVGKATITVTTVSGSASVTISYNVVNRKTFTASFYPNGASGDVVKKSCETTASSCIVTSPEINRSGFNIIGWNQDKNATTASLNVNTNIQISGDVSYYAITNKTVTATFSKNTVTNDITISASSAKCTINNSASSCNITLPTISRSGFTILGWNKDKSATSGTSQLETISISNDETYYAITKLNSDGNIHGATGYEVLNSKEYLYKTASSSSEKLATLKWGVPFTIISETGNYFYVYYEGKYGYVLHKYCMINLPDYIPSITYDITNSYSSIYKTSGYSIPNVTGKKLYNFGKTYNNRLKRQEYIAPVLYVIAKNLLTAQKTALSKGYSLKIYDVYRPHSVSVKVYNEVIALSKTNSTVKKGITQSVGANTGKVYSWDPSWFISAGVSRHNVGAAVDLTLTKKGSTTDLSGMPTAMHELSSAAIKYYSPDVSKVAKNYSGGMLNSANARLLHDIMTTNTSLEPLSSEWWHFHIASVATEMKNKEANGCDFTPQGLASQ